MPWIPGGRTHAPLGPPLPVVSHGATPVQSNIMKWCYNLNRQFDTSSDLTAMPKIERYWGLIWAPNTVSCCWDSLLRQRMLEAWSYISSPSHTHIHLPSRLTMSPCHKFPPVSSSIYYFFFLLYVSQGRPLYSHPRPVFLKKRGVSMATQSVFPARTITIYSISR